MIRPVAIVVACQPRATTGTPQEPANFFEYQLDFHSRITEFVPSGALQHGSEQSL
jgi:hypothetical protein